MDGELSEDPRRGEGALPGPVATDPVAAPDVDASAPGRAPDALPRWARVGAWLAIAGPFVLLATQVVRGSWSWLVRILPDDAFYYLEVGRRLADGQGSTFDGLHETNGYHPLWQGVLAVVSSVVSSPGAYVRAALLVGLACTFVALWLAMGVVERGLGPAPALMGGVVVAWSAVPPRLLNGMEGPVVVLGWAITAVALERALRAGDRRSAVLLGVSGGVLCLARLDQVLVVGVVVAGLVLARPAGQRVRALGHWALGLALVGVPAGLWFATSFGLRPTTSMRTKQYMVDEGIAERFGSRWTAEFVDYELSVLDGYLEGLRGALPDGGPAGRLVTLLLVALASVGLLGWVLRRTGRLPAEVAGGAVAVGSPAWAARRSLLVVAAAVALKGLVDVVLAPLWAGSWYAAPQTMAFVLAVGVLAWWGIDLVRQRTSMAVVVPVAVVALVLATAAPGRWDVDLDPPRSRSWQDQIDAAADHALAELPPARYGARDAGLLGFRLAAAGDGRTVVNLDGLVNDHPFADLVLGGAGMSERVVDRRVEILVQRLTDEELAELGCGEVLWASESVPYGDSLSAGVTEGPVYAIDVRDCW